MSGVFGVGGTSAGFSFGTPSTTAVVNPLGGSTASMFPQTSLSLGGGTNMFGVAPAPSMFTGATTSTPSLFGVPSAAPSLFGGTNTTVSTGTTPSTGIFSGLTNTGGIRPLTFPTATTAPTAFAMPTQSPFGIAGAGLQMSFPSLAAPVQPVFSVAPPTIGLGGVDFSQAVGVTGAVTGKSDSKTIKEQVLPTEISESINNFRKYVKEQKVIREEITRVSANPIVKVQEQTAALKQLLCHLSSGLQRNSSAIEKLKISSAQDLKNAEVAQRTKDLPPSLQFENTAPIFYFQEMIYGFEKQMQACGQQIEQLEQHFASLAHPFVLSPQELNVIVRRLHETFVALAGQLQTVHDVVRIQKESFLRLRSSIVGDTSNIFEKKKHHNCHQSAAVAVTLGPAPFSSYPSASALVMANAMNRTQQMGGGGSIGAAHSSFSSFGASTTINPLGQSMSSFSGPTSYGAVENKPFQLQRPPTNKRGKRWTTN